jgi:transcriptional regulator with XRE-family HTH domain
MKMTTIKTERIKNGLTQEQLSNMTGVPVRTIQNWESGIRKCPGYVEKMILDKLNQPDYKTILEEILDMLKGDLKHLKNTDTKQYVENVICDIEDSLK